ncbi:hydroxymethylbilane synthase [Frisingicoccus sp.]|uniref:hydroxymethylbilane synthase n=1 Tax=Frisingicoccus sp. TaxID=1918627 RepID=UPI0025BC8E72|nr:hydroxymethylbilane synthase [Frisingicoccus sp.]
MIIKIGTRKSQLAQIQTQIVVEKIQKLVPDARIEICPIMTEGDRRLNQSLNSFGGKGVFTKELERALLEGEIHMAVHSAKDMPMEFEEGLCLAAAVERAEWEDMMVTCDGKSIEHMKPGTVIGTGSLRRSLQICRINPGLITKDIRGNVQTRLQKLESGMYEGIILARAGVERLRRAGSDRNFLDRFFYEPLSLDQCIPAAGQAILAVETSKRALLDPEFASLCEKLNDADVWQQLMAERSFLKRMNGGCNAPACAFSWIDDGRFYIRGGFSADSRGMIYDEVSGDVCFGEALGAELAERLWNRGQMEDGGK